MWQIIYKELEPVEALSGGDSHIPCLAMVYHFRMR